jgi:hypothetical protein
MLIYWANIKYHEEIKKALVDISDDTNSKLNTEN